ncbi:hypothetical protein [Salinibaculum rarum]|uniref:hypothetical protein n=1 Tax=Salinibaculum rarum TaxID=3058903 RepID=UPI00265E7F0C|nr:hypothetical protein [Salinibaculum sp. KK48]
MTDTDSIDNATDAQIDQSISEKVERVNDIIETLENRDVSLSKAKDLRDEAHTLLESLETDMDLGDASIIER